MCKIDLEIASVEAIAEEYAKVYAKSKEIETYMEELKAKIIAKANGVKKFTTPKYDLTIVSSTKVTYNDDAIAFLEGKNLTSCIKKSVDAKKIKSAMDVGLVSREDMKSFSKESTTTTVKATSR